MKAHRILGIIWVILCSYSVFNLLWGVFPVHFGDPTLYVLAILSLINVGGIIASIFLFRGALWARWPVALVVLIAAFGSILAMVATRSLSSWHIVMFSIALVSVVLLFLPRHETVA